MSFYSVIRDICRIYLKITYRVEHLREENIPVEGACIFCSNHVSNLDPVMIGTTRKRDFFYMAKEELLSIPILGPILKHLNLIFLKRGTGDIGAVKKAIQVLLEGKALVMFPEGTRSKDGKLMEGKDGVALIAKKAGCQIVPCAVTPGHRLFRKSKVIYGEPISMTEYENLRDLKEITRRIMEEIKKLLEEL